MLTEGIQAGSSSAIPALLALAGPRMPALLMALTEAYNTEPKPFVTVTEVPATTLLKTFVPPGAVPTVT